MATDLRSPSTDGYAAFDEYIEFQLGKTKSNIKWTEIGLAGLWVAIALLGYLLFFAVFDQWVIPGGFGLIPRAIMLALLAGGTVYALVRHIVIPGAKRVHGLYAAKVVEQADPDLKSALLNYVDLQRAGQPVPPAVLKAIEKRTAVTLAKFDVDLAVDRRPLLRFSYVLLGVIVAFGLYAIFSPKDTMTSVRRALLPSSATAAPTMTVIANVTPGHTSVPARSPLIVEADIQGKVPEAIHLVYTTADRNIVDEVIEMRKIEDGLPRYRGTLLGENGRGLLQNITYRVVAGDARTEDYEVNVIQPPSARVDSVAYTYPAYMELEPRTVPGGPIDAWDGTTVSISATANMPVKSAYVTLLDVEDAHAKGEEIPAKITDGTKLTVQWKLEFREDGTAPRFYLLRVKTEKGETDPDPTLYSLKIRPDQPPEITLISPTGDLTRPANATIPLLIQASDPDFKLRSLTLRGTYRQGSERFDQRLFEEKELGQAFKGAHDFPLAPLKLKTGDKLQFWIEARDNKQPTANGRSTPRIEVTITDPVTPEQAKEQHEKDKTEQKENEEQKANADQPPQDPPPQEQPQEQKPEENPEQQPNEQQKPEGGQKGQPNEGDPSQQPDKQPGEGDPGDNPPQDSPKTDGSEDDDALEKILNHQNQKPRESRPQRPSSADERPQEKPEQTPSQPKEPSESQPSESPQKQDPSQKATPPKNPKNSPKGTQDQRPQQTPEQDPSQPGEPSESQPGEPQQNQNPSEKGKPQKNAPQRTQDQRPQQSPEKTSQPENSTDPNPMPGAESKPEEGTTAPNSQKSKGSEKPKPGEPDPSESPMPGNTSDMADSPKPETSSEKPKPDAAQQKPGEKGTTEKDPQQTPDERKKTGSEKPQPAVPERGPPKEGQPGKNQPQPQKGPNEKPSDKGSQPMPGEKAPKNSAQQTQKPEPAEGPSEKGANQPQPMPGEKPMPSSETQPGDEGMMPGSEEKPQAGSPMVGQEKPGAKPQPGEMPKDPEMPQEGNQKNPPGGSSKPEKPGDNPQPDMNPEGQGGTETETKNPPGAPQRGQQGKPNAQQPQNATDPGKATQPTPGGEEKPSEDSPDARREKATGMEEGVAEGSEKPDPDATQAQKPLQKKPGTKGARQPGQPSDQPEPKPGEQTPSTDPNRKGNDGGASDMPEKAQPATAQKTKNEPPENPEGVENDPDAAKNPDRPREKRPGQPDAGNEELKGNGRKQGQKSEQPDGGEAGGSKTAEKGNQGSDERGPGDRDTEPGDAETSEKPTGGQPSEQKGMGEQSAPSDSGKQPGEKGGSKPSQGGQKSQGGQPSKSTQGSPSEGKSEPGEPGDSARSDSGNGVRGKSDDPANDARRPGREGGGPTERREPVDEEEATTADAPGEANLRKNRDASNLVLRRLKDDLSRGEVDQDLLKQLGWSEENLKQFVDRMDQKLNDTGEDNSPEALARRKRFEEFLRSLKVGEKTQRRQSGTRATRLSPNIQSDSTVPPEYRDQVEAYTKSLAK